MENNLLDLHNQIFNSYQEAHNYRENNFTLNVHYRLYIISKLEHRNLIKKAIIIAPVESDDVKSWQNEFLDDFSKYSDELSEKFSTNNKFQLRSHIINGFLEKNYN